MNLNLEIGDTIRDVEDGDCYYEGVVVSTNPLKYKVNRIVWNNEERIQDSFIGQVIEPAWYYLTYIKIKHD